MSNLITPNRQWHVAKLAELFSHDDMEAILSIPLSMFPGPDIIIWHYTNNDMYLVKSGYGLAESFGDSASSSTNLAQRSWWRRFWALKLPNKVKVFVWWAYFNALPTAMRLHRCRIIDSAACSLCSLAWEFVGHALFSCKHAKAVWRFTSFRLDYGLLRSLAFTEFLHLVAASLRNTELEHLFIITWCIWGERNKRLHGGKKKPVDLVAS